MADKVRVGIIGTGGISNGHIRRLIANPDAEITAICDIRPEAMADKVSRYPELKDVPQFTDFKDMIAAGNLDAVEICTPHTTHYEQTMTCLDKGLHVLSEKPMVCTIAHAHDVLKKIDESGKVFVLNYQRSYQPEFLFIKQAIESGEYGEVQFIQGLQGQEWLRGCAGTWRHDPALSGGGQLNDSGSHMLDILLFVTGLEVESVFGYIENLGAKVDINSALSLKFTSGAIGNISVVGNGPSFYEDITIFCSNGAFYMRNGKLEVSDGMGKRTTPATEDLPKGNNPDDNFIAAILGKEEIGSPAIWGLRVIELTEPAWESAATGERANVKR